jgi:peptide/nickel transport system substrate-binding protein
VSPFDDPRVRRAVAYAVPYETILDEVYKGYAGRNRSPFSAPGTPTYTEEYWVYETDLDKARDLLAEAGYADGFETTLAVKAGIEEDEEAAVWIKASLEEIGVTVNVQSMPLGAWLTEARAHTLPMYISTHAFWINDPFYGYYWGLRTGGGPNYANYSNAEIDDTIAEYLASPDEDARMAASMRIQEIAAEELPCIPLATVNVNVAMRENVKGYYFSFDGTHVTRFYTMYKE